MLTLTERFGGQNELYRRMMDEQVIGLRVASPGVIQSFDADKQTATVQLAIREKVNLDGNITWEDVPLLLDVPVIFPRGGGYSVTLPVGKGTEVLVIFGDNCIDSFWQSGGTGNTQMDLRSHDFSDGMAIPTGISQPNKLSTVSTDSLQIKNDEGTAMLEVKGTTINILGGNINIGENTTIDGRLFLAHTHHGVESGNSSTGGVD